MAINYSYPKIGALATGDLLMIVDISNDNRTNTLEIGDLSSYIITTSSLTNGSGTATFIPKWSDADTLTDSLMSESASSINVTGDLNASNDLIAGRDLTVTRTASIGDLTVAGATISNSFSSTLDINIGDSLVVAQDGSFGNDLLVSNDFTVTGDTVLNTVRITSTLADASSSVGTSGQVLSSTATGTAWVNPETQAFSSLTTTGTTGAATLTAGVLNIPTYASSALPYASMFVRITQSGSNQPSYSVLSNTTGASITGISSSNGKYTLILASGTYPDDGDAMVITGGYRSGRSSNSEVTGHYASQQIIITTGWWDYNGGTQASFVREDLGYGGTESLIFEFRVFS